MSNEFDLVVGHLSESLKLLSASADEQVKYLHEAEEFVLPVDEFAQDYVHWMQSYFSFGGAAAAPTLRQIDGILEKFSGMENAEHWSEDALKSDPVWKQVRKLARGALEELSDVSNSGFRPAPG